MPKSYVPRGIETPGQYRLPGRRRRPRGQSFGGGGSGTTQGGGRRPPRRIPRTPTGVVASAPRRPAPVYRPPTVAKNPIRDYASLTMPSRKGSGPFGDSELRAGYRRMGEALGRADQPGVKAALSTRMRAAKGEMPPKLNLGQVTALRYTREKGEKSGASVKRRRSGVAAKILMREQGY